MTLSRALFSDRYSAPVAGSVTLFFAFLLPVFSLFIALAIDVGSLYRTRSNEQAIADSAVLAGAKQLPLRPVAEQTVRNFLYSRSAYLRSAPDTPIEFRRAAAAGDTNGSRDAIAIAYTVKAHIPLLGLLYGSKTLDVPIAAKARLNPRDTVLFFDSSRYTAPDPRGNRFLGPEYMSHFEQERDPEDPDGITGTFSMFFYTDDPSEAKKWPAANFISRRFASHGKPHVLTQQCFNPVLAAFKENVIRAYDSLSSVPLNSVGILTGPRPNGGVFTIRPVNQGGGPFEGAVENVSYASSPIRDQHCLATAEEVMPSLAAWQATEEEHGRSAGNPNWRYPQQSLRYGFPYYPTALHPRGRYDFQRVTREDGNLRTERLEYLSARAAVWARGVNPNQEIDIRRVLSGVTEALRTAPPRIAERGALADLGVATAYIVLGHMPRLVNASGTTTNRFESQGAERQRVKEGMRAALRLMNQEGRTLNRTFHLVLMIVRHHQAYPQPECQFWICQPFLDDFEELERFLNGIDDQMENVSITSVRVPDVSSIAMDFSSYLPLLDRGVFLAN